MTAAHPRIDARPAWTRLAMSLLLAVIGNVGMWSIIVSLPAMQADLGGGRGAASLPYTATMLGFALGNFVLGRAVDRFGVSVTLGLGAALSGLAHAAAALAPGVPAIALAQFLIGVGTAAFFGPLMADVSLWFRSYRGIAVSIAASGTYMAGAVWPLFLRGLLEAGDWRTAYLIIGAIGLASALPAAWLLRHRLPPEDLSEAAQATTRTRRRPLFTPRTTMWMLALAGVGCCVAMSMPQVHLVALCVDLGFGPAVGSQMLSVMLFAGVVSRIVSGLLMDRIGGIATLLIGSSLQMLALFLYLPFDGLVSLYLVSLVFGLSQGGIVPSYAVIVRETMPAREAGSRVGLVIMMTIVGMALGGWMSGAIYDLTGSYMMAFVNGIGWNLLNIALIGALAWSIHKQGNAPKGGLGHAA